MPECSISGHTFEALAELNKRTLRPLRLCGKYEITRPRNTGYQYIGDYVCCVSIGAFSA